MRSSFGGRHCLYRLRQPSLQPARIRRSAFHAQAACQIRRSPPLAIAPAREHHGPSQPVPSADPSDVAGPALSTRGRLGAQSNDPSTRLKPRILGTLGHLANLDLLILQVQSAYGLSMPAAHDAIDQLKRLLRGCPPWQAAARLDQFSFWKTTYTRLLQGRDKPPLPPQLVLPNVSDEASPDASLSHDPPIPTVPDIDATWVQMDAKEREEFWPRMVLYLLDSKPATLISFLQATYDASWSPPYVVEDTLRALYLRLASFDGAERSRLVDLLIHLLYSSPDGHLAVGQDVLASFTGWAELPQVIEILQVAEASGHPLSVDTLLHFAARFAESPDHKVMAAEILTSMSSIRGFDINSASASSVCTTLLNIRTGDRLPDGQAAPDELFRMLLECGLQPNLLNFTALMKNFTARGHLDTAWTVYDLMTKYGIEADDHVHSILLNAAKKSLDAPSAHRVMASYHGLQQTGSWNEFIVNDFLDILLRDNEAQPEKRRRQRKSNNAFRPMLQFYAKFYHLEPLQKFIQRPLEDVLAWPGPPERHSTPFTQLAEVLAPQPEQLLKQPDTTALLLMLAANIRSLTDPKPIMRAYLLFNQLVEREDPHALRIIQRRGSMVHDIFLRGLMQFRSHLGHSFRTVQSLLQLAQREETEHGKNMKHPYPSVYTWTILMQGFRNHGMPNAARKVFKMMVQEGHVQPTLVAWNTLVGAYAKVGNVEDAVKVLRYIEASGLQPDQNTVRAMEQLPARLRENAIELLEASKRQPLDKSIADLSELVGTRLASQAPILVASPHAGDGEHRDESALGGGIGGHTPLYSRVRTKDFSPPAHGNAG